MNLTVSMLRRNIPSTFRISRYQSGVQGKDMAFRSEVVFVDRKGILPFIARGQWFNTWRWNFVYFLTCMTNEFVIIITL